MNFSQFNKNGGVEGFCLIKFLERKYTAKGLPYLDMILADSSGEISAKLWDFREELHGSFATNQLVKVRGTLSVYNDNDQLRVEKMRRTIDSDGVKIEDYVPSAPFEGEQMLAQIIEIAQGFEDKELKKLVSSVIDEYRDKLLYYPAAVKLHHAVRGGLLYHTLSILRLAQGVCEVYPFVDRDLLYSGIILHDIAKTEEFNVSETGIATGYTVDGTLIGHLVRGAIAIEQIGSKIGISSQTLMLVEHMLISHHGEPEFGAAVRPMYLEAEILSELDLMDARIFEIAQAVSSIETGEFTPRMWSLDNRKLYNHGRRCISPEPKLF
ncbi:MAG: HD domain-containing protein [Clostridiales bacterium]|nr:HD domain-containing protein [Clostridiales bacterium]